MLAITFEAFFFYASIAAAIIGVVGYRIYLASRRINMWKKGHAPGHEAFLELPYPRDMAFLAAREILPRHYTLVDIGDRERIVLGMKRVWMIRNDRVSVKVNPTLAGCEVLFARLGPLWWKHKKGVESEEARAFFNDLENTLSAWQAAGYTGHRPTEASVARQQSSGASDFHSGESAGGGSEVSGSAQPGWVHSGGTGLTPGD